MKLKAVDNQVSFYMIAGKDVVHNQMTLKAAETVISLGKEVKESVRFIGHHICVDDKFFFEGEFSEKKGKKKTSSEVEPKEVSTGD